MFIYVLSDSALQKTISISQANHHARLMDRKLFAYDFPIKCIGFKHTEQPSLPQDEYVSRKTCWFYVYLVVSEALQLKE